MRGRFEPVHACAPMCVFAHTCVRQNPPPMNPKAISVARAVPVDGAVSALPVASVVVHGLHGASTAGADPRDSLPQQIRSADYPSYSWSIESEDSVTIRPSNPASFMLVPGLHGTGTVSFQDSRTLDFYLRHASWYIRRHRYGESEERS